MGRVNEQARAVHAASLGSYWASPLQLTPVTLTASPTGGASVEYQFLVDDGTGWNVIRGYGPAPSCAWTPNAADSYFIKVVARETGEEEGVAVEVPYSVE